MIRFKVLDVKGSADGVDRGVIDLKIQWVYDPKVNERMAMDVEKRVRRFVQSVSCLHFRVM